MARLSQLLSRRGFAVTAPNKGGDAPEGEEVGACASPIDAEVDEPIIMRENVCLGPFQMEIIEEKVNSLLGETAHVMVMPLKSGDTQPRRIRPLPPGLHILHTYMCLKNGSGKVSVVVRNVSHSHIYLKKGTQVAQIMSASPVLPTELSLEMEATLGIEVWPEPMSVDVHQEKLLDKLNLDGLRNWSAAVARELVLAHHDILHWIATNWVAQVQLSTRSV